MYKLVQAPKGAQNKIVGILAEWMRNLWVQWAIGKNDPRYSNVLHPSGAIDSV
jgi:hypothetical protein